MMLEIIEIEIILFELLVVIAIYWKNETVMV